jgi:hypothetical protein
MAIDVGDVAAAAIEVVEVGPDPVAFTGLAAGMEVIPPNFDVPAAIGIGSAGQSPISIPVSIPISIPIVTPVAVVIVAIAAAAAKLAIDVDDAFAATVKIVEPGPNPAAIARLAPGAENIAAHIDRSACFNVSSSCPPGSPAALELSIVVHNFTDATANVV